MNLEFFCCSGGIAKTLVPDIEPAPEAPEGVVELNVQEQRLLHEAQPGDFVLSRTNAKLLDLFFAFLKAERPVAIVGRDASKTIFDSIRRVTSGGTSMRILEFLDCFEASQAERIRRAERTKDEREAARKVRHLKDETETLNVLCDDLKAKTVADLEEKVRRLVWVDPDSEENGLDEKVILSTVHKAKGLEADTVWVIAPTLYVYGFAWDEEEEENIHYVALTRAKKRLFMVGEVPEPREKKV